MSVLPHQYECPIDSVIIDMCAAVAPFFKETGHTANAITFEGGILSAYSLYLLYNYDVKNFALFYALGYAFDCLDGHFARRYKMVSKFGEYFEHIKDILTTVGYFYILLKKYEITMPVATVFTVAGFGLLSHMGHQQRYLGSKGGFLDPLQHLAKNPRNMRYTRWLGCGTFMVLSIAAPFFLRRKMRLW